MGEATGPDRFAQYKQNGWRQGCQCLSFQF